MTTNEKNAGRLLPFDRRKFVPVSVKDLGGRRAEAWFVTNGVRVLATDAGVAGHALSAVLQALRNSNDPRLNIAWR